MACEMPGVAPASGRLPSTRMFQLMRVWSCATVNPSKIGELTNNWAPEMAAAMSAS